MELADMVLPDLIKAAGNTPSEAVRVLANWDHMTETDSRGAVLFQMFATAYLGSGARLDAKLRVKYDPAKPLDGANGLADPAGALAALETAAANCVKTYGSLDVKWGDVYRFASGTADLPGNGGPGSAGVFRTVTYSRKVGNRYYAAHGETFVCGIEFAKVQKAQCLVSYGNASQPGSPHLEDQLPLMIEKKLHPVWRDKKEVEAHLEKRETF